MTIISNNIKETSKDKNGNPVQLIGYNFSIEFTKDMFNRENILLSARQNNIPEKIFRENSKRNSFKNALNNQKKVTKKEDKVINFVEEDGMKITFQLDHKIIEEHNRSMETSDGNTEMVSATSSKYITDTIIIYDKATDRILCDDNELLSLVYKELKIFQESYLKRNMTKYINNLLENEAGMIPWRSAGGVYFVPARYKPLLMNIINFVTQIDINAVVKVAEVPDMNFSCQSVKESAEQSLKKDLNEIRSGIKDLEENSDELSSRMKENRIQQISKLTRRAEEYGILVESELKDVKWYAKVVEQTIRNYSMYGTVKSPVKKSEFTKEQLEQLPEDVLVMLEC